MKRFMKRMGFLMVLVLLSTSYIFSIGVNATDVDEFLIEKYGEEFMANLDQAHENDEALMALFPKNESGEPVYPDFIGGIYYNDDGNMVVQMVTDAQTNDVDLRTAVDNLIAERNIIVEYVEFSHNEISASRNYMGGSVGYRAKLNGVEGFVTHGHGITNGQKVVINGHTYGTVIRQQCSGTVDASFVQTTSRGIPMNDWIGGVVSVAVRTKYNVGDVIYKVGSASSYTVGKVIDISRTANGISGLVQTDCWAQPGDSGGIVVVGENNTTAGIVKCGPVGGGGLYFCRADVINAKWGLVRY